MPFGVVSAELFKLGTSDKHDIGNTQKYTEILSVLWYKDLSIYLVALLMCATVRYKYCSNSQICCIDLMCTT